MNVIPVLSMINQGTATAHEIQPKSATCAVLMLSCPHWLCIVDSAKDCVIVPQEEGALWEIPVFVDNNWTFPRGVLLGRG